MSSSVIRRGIAKKIVTGLAGVHFAKLLDQVQFSCDVIQLYKVDNASLFMNANEMFRI